MEVVELVGLITCVGVVYRHGAILLGWRRRRFICLGVVHMEEGVQVGVQVEVGREEQGEGETHGKEQNEEQRSNEKQSTAHHGWHEDDTSARYTDTFSGSS